MPAAVSEVPIVLVHGGGHGALAGHSLAGLTICEVARHSPERVAHLVFVSALVPPEGMNAVDAMPPELIERVAGGLTEEIVVDMFCNDLDAGHNVMISRPGVLASVLEGVLRLSS